MPDSWFSIGFPGVVWVVSALMALGSLSPYANYGIIGLIAWVVFIGGIIIAALKVLN